MRIEDQEEARALFADAVENMGISILELDMVLYNLEHAVDEDEIAVEAAFDAWLADQDVPDEAHNSWTAVD